MLPSLDEIQVERINQANDADKKAKKRNLVVDMNPMVDLAFLLLTFFMLATTFVKPQAMELLVPAKPKETDVQKETPVKESKTLSLVLFKEKIVWYHGISEPVPQLMSYDKESLTELLLSEDKKVEGLVVFIKPRDESAYRNLVRLLDVINETEIKRYAISDLSDYDKELNTELPKQ